MINRRHPDDHFAIRKTRAIPFAFVLDALAGVDPVEPVNLRSELPIAMFGVGETGWQVLPADASAAKTVGLENRAAFYDDVIHSAA